VLTAARDVVVPPPKDATASIEEPRIVLRRIWMSQVLLAVGDDGEDMIEECTFAREL
jgi:hypothetical protein